jgi:dsDNA-specific endonuclease/ATPase MutS2
MDEPVKIPIEGILDLHTFSPSEIDELIPDYLQLCLEKNIFRVRIIHGKGTGALRRSVHAILKKLPFVSKYQVASEDEGGWGASIVYLAKKGAGKQW